MSKLITCKRCKRVYWHTDNHRCPPSWLCRYTDDDIEDAETIYADDQESAACEYARKHSNNHMEGEFGVIVCDSNGENPKTHLVIAVVSLVIKCAPVCEETYRG